MPGTPVHFHYRENITMKFNRLAAAVFGTAALLTASVSFATHSWGGYHWARTSNPFTLQVLDSTVANSNANWPSLLQTAASEWSQSTVMNLTVSPYSNTSTARKRCSAVTGKIRVCNASYGSNGWLGLASINLSGSHITQGTAKMNDSYTSTWTSDPNEARHVMCQEVGHDFGLDHQSTTGASLNTCMDYSSSPTSVSPNAHDYDELVTIYSHLDTSTTIGFSAGTSFAKAGSEMLGDVPLGTLVRRDHFFEIYVAPDGKGGLWINRVTLAPEAMHVRL